MRRRREDTPTIAAIFLSAFAIRLAFVLAIRPKPISDFGWYYARAIDIVHGLGYSVHGHPTAFWPLGWPYFLAAVVRLFGPSVLAAEIVQALLGALTTLVVYLLGKHIGGKIAGVTAAAAYAILPSAVEWSATLASEPLYTLLCAYAIYIWVSRSTDKLGWFALSGAVLGVAALVRPSALLFGVVLLAYLLSLRTMRAQPARIAKAVAITVCCTILVVTPVIVRNYFAFGTLVVISNNGGVSLYQGNNATATGGYSELRNPEIAKLISDPRTEVAGDHLASQLAVRYIETHPQHELWLSLQKIKALYSHDDGVLQYTFRAVVPPASAGTIAFVTILNTAMYYTFMTCALLGIVLCLFQRRNEEESPGWRLILGMILYNTAVFAIIGGIDRYRYPTMPYFAVFAGIGIVAIYAYVRSAFTAPARVRSEA